MSLTRLSLSLACASVLALIPMAGATDYRSEVAPAPARLRAGQLAGIVD